MEKKVEKQPLKEKSFIFYNNKELFNTVLSFLDEKNQVVLKKCFKKTNYKEKKKEIKDFIKSFILDFGEYNDKYKYKITENKTLLLTTTIFNIEKNHLKEFTLLFHKETNDKLEIEKDDLYAYLKVLPSMDFTLSNSKGENLRLSKGVIPYDLKDDNLEDIFEEKKYEMFYNQNEDLKNIDFSNKESLISRQNKLLETLNSNKEKIFYPLEFISNVTYWSVILCHGGYFAAGFFYKEKLMDHKSDHKYVTRKKAGQRQINKDKSKAIKNSVGAQLRRDGEKKHQENIEYILKLKGEFLEKSDVIFLQAPGLNKTIFIGEDRSLTSFKKKIVNIPYNCQRANYTNMLEITGKLIGVTLEITDNKTLQSILKV